MDYLNKIFAALEAWFARRAAPLDHPRASWYAIVIVPLLFGLRSLYLGQDDNWDMHNYHLYNPYAWLHDRVGVDVAPAGFQSYFNPVLDVFYYVLSRYMPAPALGFLYGWLHGLNFVLLVAIGRQLLGAAVGGRWILLLAAAGTLGPAFLSEVGNTQGDNMVALLVLASLYLLLRQWDDLLRWGKTTVLALLAAGLLMGLGVGLKMTNVTFALALCLALLAVPLRAWQRLRLALMYGVGVLAGMTVTAGFWMFKLWQLFGNPLFPQFNDIFRSPLALQLGVIDTHFRPRGLGESLLWPFIFTLQPYRVGEVPMHQIVWPALYLLALAWGATVLYRRVRGGGSGVALEPRRRFVLLFVALAFLAWMKLFSIYRYLVPVELLAPLMLWLLLHAMLPARPARRLGCVLLAACWLFSLPVANWGHASWAARAASAELPSMARPETTIVFIAKSDPPMTWLVPFFPSSVQFIALGTGFPESSAYLERAHTAMAARRGPHFVMLPATKDDPEATRRRKLALVQWLGLTDSAAACARLDQLLRKVRFHVDVAPLPGGRCTLVLPPQYRADPALLAAEDRAVADLAARHMASYGVLLHADRCKVYQAQVGNDTYPYQLCEATLPPARPPAPPSGAPVIPGRP